VDRITVVNGDTDLTPYAPGEGGSQTTGATGTAVIEASRKVREQLLAQASDRLKVRREDLDLRDGKIVSVSNPSRFWPIAEVTSRNIDAISAAVMTELPGDEGKERMSFAAHFAEVEVHLETGKVKVLRYVAAHDSGTIVNKLTAGSQVKGAVAQGIGMALREELIWDKRTGVPINNHYHGAKPVLHVEVPEVEVLFVESDDGYGPFGAKSLGEIPMVPVVAAIANGIYVATGVRLRELPMTPVRLLNAFHKAEARTEGKAG
jgi:xanthine dehydrogenase molybdenum-binding subunit